MTTEELRALHLEQHKGLDKLLAAFIVDHPGRVHYLKTTVDELMAWSYERTFPPKDDDPVA